MTEKTRKIFLTMAVLLVLASCGGKEKNSAETREERRPVLSENKDVEDIETAPTPEPVIYYTVNLVENTLSMYEIADGSKILVKSIIIDPSYYPPEDISELKGGITAYTKESGFEILENFAN
ncbi:MAG: hypothetical protein PUE13_00635 [Clostridiales bacterium]|nr:hypothetical protein [Clostridiales bacterium]